MLAPIELIRQMTNWLHYATTGVVLAAVVVRMRQPDDGEREFAEL